MMTAEVARVDMAASMIPVTDPALMTPTGALAPTELRIALHVRRRLDIAGNSREKVLRMEIARRTFLKSVTLVPFAAQLFLKDPAVLQGDSESIEIVDYLQVYKPQGEFESEFCVTLTGKVRGPARIESFRTVGQGQSAYCGLLRNGVGDPLIDRLVGWHVNASDTFQMMPAANSPIIVPEGEFVEMHYCKSSSAGPIPWEGQPEPWSRPITIIYFYRG